MKMITSNFLIGGMMRDFLRREVASLSLINPYAVKILADMWLVILVVRSMVV